MSVQRPRRSVLYMPASNARAMEKARDLPCDVVIFDLEDAVAPEQKDLAREQACAAVGGGGFGRRELVIRVNGLDTPWGAADLKAAAAAAPDAVLVPKVARAADVAAYDAALSSTSERTRLWAMIETARAVFRLEEIADAAATTRLSAWVMGTNDLAKETGARIAPGRAAFVGVLSLAVTAARMAGLTVLDGVFNGLDDDAGLEAECRQALELGFDGKTLIHPRQVDIANRVFSPSDEEVAFARAVIAAFADPANAGKGALRVDGRMAERLHLAGAEKTVAVADAIGAA
jgi:citrate lyase subunit beta/citryl-CoA lyase